MAGIQSHKENTNPILKFYYSFPFLLLFCVGNEAFAIANLLWWQDRWALTRS